MTEEELSLTQDCLAADFGLSTKEIQFLEDIYKKHEDWEELGVVQELSPRQTQWLSDIGDRLGLGGLV